MSDSFLQFLIPFWVCLDSFFKSSLEFPLQDAVNMELLYRFLGDPFLVKEAVYWLAMNDLLSSYSDLMY